MTFVASLTIPQLGVGAGYALWGFRAIAIGHRDCPALVRGFERLFEEKSTAARNAVYQFAGAISTCGNRRIAVAEPGSCGVTSDELSIVAVLAAAQRSDAERRDAHLLWLLAQRKNESAGRAADSVGLMFKAAGLLIDQPPIQLFTPRQSNTLEIVEPPAVATSHAVV